MGRTAVTCKLETLRKFQPLNPIKHTHNIMLALFALLVVGATAAPQYLQYPGYQYPVYPQYQHQYFVPQPQLRYVPQAAYPNYYYPGAISPVQAQTRGLFGLPDITIPGFQTATAGFKTQGSSSTMVLQGNVEFKQNPLTGSNSRYTIYMVDGGDVKVAGTEFQIYVYTVACTSSVTASTVTTSGTKLTSITGPGLLVNGFYAKGNSDKYNVDGTDGKTSIVDKYVYIVSKDGNTINGCTDKITKQ